MPNALLMAPASCSMAALRSASVVVYATRHHDAHAMDSPGRSRMPAPLPSRVKPYRVAGAVSRRAKTSKRPRRMETKEREASKLKVIGRTPWGYPRWPLGCTFMSPRKKPVKPLKICKNGTFPDVEGTAPTPPGVMRGPHSISLRDENARSDILSVGMSQRVLDSRRANSVAQASISSQSLSLNFVQPPGGWNLSVKSGREGAVPPIRFIVALAFWMSA